MFIELSSTLASKDSFCLPKEFLSTCTSSNSNNGWSVVPTILSFASFDSKIKPAQIPNTGIPPSIFSLIFFKEPDKVKEAQKMIDERQSMLGLDVDKLELRMQERGSTVLVSWILEFELFREM